jgi:hypothetical protein
MQLIEENETGIELTCVIGADQVIYLTMGGDISREHITEFDIWAGKVKKAMVSVSEKNNKKVFTLIDITRLNGFDMVTTKALYRLMAFNRNYATKTAVYGAGPVTRLALDAIITATHRTTMKVFPDRTVAESWLHDDKQMPEKDDKAIPA